MEKTSACRRWRLTMTDPGFIGLQVFYFFADDLRFSKSILSASPLISFLNSWMRGPRLPFRTFFKLYQPFPVSSIVCKPSQGPLQFPRWNSRHTLNFPFRILFVREVELTGAELYIAFYKVQELPHLPDRSEGAQVFRTDGDLTTGEEHPGKGSFLMTI